MDNIIYSYGGGEALFSVLTGVKMIFDSNITKDLTYLMTFIGLIWAAFQGASQNSFMPKLNWLVKYALITSLFITPKADLTVTDVVYNTRYPVDGLPIGLVLPATLFSSIGFAITESFDQAFSSVNNIPYTKYGQSFGAALISQSRNFKIQDSAFRENIEGFIDNCVLYDVMVGTKYSASDLRDEQNIWSLVSQNASSIRMFNYRDQVSSGRRLVTCREGVGLLESYWKTDIEKLGERYGRTIFGKYGSKAAHAVNNANKEILGKSFIANINVVSQLYGKTNTATDTLKQIMMINAIADIPMSYGAVRAKQQQQESWLISGQLAREILPTLHAVFAALIYASFSLIVGMLVLPNGFRTLGNYLGLLIWIETWPPLFAVINLLTNVSSKAYGGDFTAITMNSASQIISHNNNISVVASGMMMVLPYLSYNILKGGAGQFVHLASQVMGASQSAASSASAEVTSGNRSLDNVSMSNGQWFNNSGFKTDMNAMFKAGHSEYQLADGTLVKESPDGKMILHSGPGITTDVGSKAMHMTVSNSSQSHQSLSHERSLLDSKHKLYDKTEQSAQRESAEFVKRVAAGELSGINYNYDHTSASGKVFHDAVAKEKQLQSHHAYTHNQASGMGVSATLGGNVSAGSGGGGASVSAGAEISASGSANHVNEQAIIENKGASTNTSVTTQAEDIARVARSMHFGSTQTGEKALADSLVGSYEEMQQLKDEMMVCEQNIQKYQTSIENTQSVTSTVSDDIYHKELQFIAEQKDQYGYPIGKVQASKIIEKGGAQYDQYHKAFESKHLPAQKMIQYNGNYAAKVQEIIPQQNLKQNYVAVKAQGTSSIGSDAKINKQAHQEFVQQNVDNSLKIDSGEVQITNNGNMLQDKSNQGEKDRSLYSKTFLGTNKKEDEAFKD